MRKTLNKFIKRYPNAVLLHCDMWGFDGPSINCGIQEPNMVNIAAGMASQGKKVIVYGIAGFVLYKSYEQIKLNVKGWAENYGSVVFVNAGRNGCYSVCGRGHLVEDDQDLLKALGMKLHTPKTRKEFLRNLKDGLKQNGSSFIRLGWDGEEWD